jgi:hypothetical protein
MQASFYWSAYTVQMLAVGVATAHGQHILAAEYAETAREYLNKHFDAIERHLERIGAYNG